MEMRANKVVRKLNTMVTNFVEGFRYFRRNNSAASVNPANIAVIVPKVKGI
jgi:hypothetical protein